MDDHRRNLLRAALGEGPSAAAAYRKWRARFSLDNIDQPTFRMLPLLLRASERLGMADQYTARMRGVAKHIWLSNVLGLRLLAEATRTLQQAHVDAMLMKGGALFARDEQLSHLHFASDYDLQVPRRDAPHAISALLSAGFCHDTIRAELFTQSDFDLAHAVPLVKKTSKSSIDLHWRPLPELRDETFVDELLARAEHADLFGQKVAIPSVTDHLFLCVVRPEPWERDEIFQRAVEATLLLRHCNGNLDWDRFQDLVGRFRLNLIAAAMLRLIRDEINVPVPGHVVERLGRQAGPFRKLELFLHREPPAKRAAVKKLVLSAFDIARSRPNGSLATIFLRPDLRTQFARSAEEQLRKLTGPDLAKIWEDESMRSRRAAPGEIIFARGFSYPERDGRWTDGLLAVLQVPVDSLADGAVHIRMTVRPFVPPGETAFALLLDAGFRVKHYHLMYGKGEAMTLTVKSRVVGADLKRVVLVFNLLDARSPSALGLNEDQRQLGLFFRKIEPLYGTADESIPSASVP